jgi:4-amino-4-deoxy-L-arabinose transferase-like glycosyltransferase
MSLIKHKYFIVIILLVGLALRMNDIKQPYIDSFGWREASTAMMADNFYKGHWNILLPQVYWGGPPPNYQGRELQTVTYIAAVFYNLIGKHDWIGRSICIIFGLLGIFSLYSLISLIWNREIAAVSSFILAVLPGSVFIDRSFLPDPAMTALATTSLWLFAKYVQEKRFWLLALAFVAFTVAALTKLQALTVVAPVAYILINDMRSQSQNNQTIYISTFTFISFATVFAYYAWTVYVGNNFPPYHVAGSGKFIWDNNIWEWISNWYFAPAIFNELTTWLWGWVVVLLTVVSLVLPFRKDIGLDSPWIFHFWALAFLLVFIIEAEHLSIDVWNMSILNPIAAGLSGLAIFSICRYMPNILHNSIFRMTVYSLVIGVIGFFGQMELTKYFKDHYIAQYKLGLQLALLSQDRNDLIVSLGLEPISMYYSGLYGWVFPPASVWEDERLYVDSHERVLMLETLREQGAKWFIIPKWKFDAESEPILAAYISANCIVTKYKDAGKICSFRRN